MMKNIYSRILTHAINDQTKRIYRERERVCVREKDKERGVVRE
jgi:hypothetical protein